MFKYSFLLVMALLVSLQVLHAQGTGENSNSILTVFPNPSDGSFNVSYTSGTASPPDGWGGILIINITNAEFQTIYTETIKDFDGDYNKVIDLHAQESGEYLVEIVAGKTRRSQRARLN